LKTLSATQPITYANVQYFYRDWYEPKGGYYELSAGTSLIQGTFGHMALYTSPPSTKVSIRRVSRVCPL
jgi:hypothetical protein